MTRDDIIRMARKAGVTDGIELPDEVAAVERFAALVAAAEREACAKVCVAIEAERWNAYKTGTPEQGRGQPFVEGQSDGAEQCAAAIRARSKRESWKDREDYEAQSAADKEEPNATR